MHLSGPAASASSAANGGFGGALGGGGGSSSSSLLSDPFVQRFARFWEALSALPDDQKPVALRRLVRNLPPSLCAVATEFVELMVSSRVYSLLGAAKPAGGAEETSAGCTCVFCPYREELQKIHDYYSLASVPEDDFLFGAGF